MSGMIREIPHVCGKREIILGSDKPGPCERCDTIRDHTRRVLRAMSQNKEPRP